MGLRVFKLTSILACGILALAASPALARKVKKRAGLGPVSTVKAIGPTVSTGSTSTATATCPSGKQAAGGGFSAPFDATSSLVVTDSFRSSTRSWTVIGVPEAGSSGAATAYAYCRQTTKTIMDVGGTGVVGNYMFGGGTAQATCPVDSSLIGGGFESTKGVLTGPVQIAIPEASFPTPGAWTVEALNNSTPAQTIVAHAYCVFRILPSLTVRSSNIQAVNARFDTVTAMSPNCLPKKRSNKRKRKRQFLSAGGFNIEGGTGPIVIVATQSMLGPKGTWVAQVSSVLNQPATAWLDSQAICD